MAEQFIPPPAPGGSGVPYCTVHQCLICICATLLHCNVSKHSAQMAQQLTTPSGGSCVPYCTV